jgi:ubiquinone/menaquinone biosynthesis C-methylase UbiE
MLRYAAEKKLLTVCTPVEHLPFATGCFDRVLMIDALHHVIDQKQTVRELCRVLTPSGRLIIIEPEIRRFIVKIIALGEKLLLMRSHFLSSEKISALFENLNVYVRVEFYKYNVVILVEKKSGK